jgi:hypothetical protein
MVSEIIMKDFVDSFEAPEALAYFIEKNGFVRYRRIGQQRNMRRFLETGRSKSYFAGMSTWSTIDPRPAIPHFDHAWVFSQKRGGHRCVVSHPYASKEQLLEDMPTWAKVCDLAVDIYSSARSWYRPRITSMYIVHLPDVEIAEPLPVWTATRD